MRSVKARLTDEWPLAIAATACFVFGLWCLAYVQSAGDGSWYFYATELARGTKLYSEQHLVLQPVFVLVNMLGLSVFGETFVGQKLVFVPILAGYLYFAAALVSRAQTRGSLKALLFLAFFFAGIHFEAYRFDDYHVFENMLTMAVVKFSLDYLDSDPRHPWVTSISIGICLALALLTRINDGLAVFLVVSFYYMMRRHPSGARHYVAMLGALLGTAASVFAAIGETPTAWTLATISGGAAAKGGGASLALYPVELIRNCLAYVFHGNRAGLPGLLVQGTLLTSLAFFVIRHGSRRTRALTWVLASAGAFLILWRFLIVDTVSAFTAVVILALTAFCAIRAPLWLRDWMDGGVTVERRGREMLFLVPLVLFFSGSMSSGGGFHGLYFPFALALVIWGLAFGGLRVERLTGALAAVALLHVAVYGFFFKLYVPYAWHSYRATALIDHRVIHEAGPLGRMPIDPGLLAFINPICAVVKPAESALLSLPFPYANYFCGVPPWNGYVQTFFDTTSRGTIDQLIADLKSGPPRYILYQRQVDSLARHERIYNGGKPLPHRALDEYILQQIESGEWKVASSTVYGVDTSIGTESLWLLLETPRLSAR